MRSEVAAVTTYFNINDITTVHQIANGEPVTVYGILIGNLSANNKEVTIRTADGNDTTLFTVETDIGGVFVANTPFLADKGIEFIGVTSATDVHVTVWHSSPGV